MKNVNGMIALQNGQIEGEGLLMKMMEKGRIVSALPSVTEIRKRTLERLARLPFEIRGIGSNASYRIEISEALKNLAGQLIERRKK